MEKFSVYKVRVTRSCSSTGISSKKETLCHDYKTAFSYFQDVLLEFKVECIKNRVTILHEFSAERSFPLSDGSWMRFQFITLRDGDTFAQSFDVVLDEYIFLVK